MHPQGRAVSALPRLEGVVGPGPGKSVGAGSGAVGVRVLDLTGYRRAGRHPYPRGVGRRRAAGGQSTPAGDSGVTLPGAARPVHVIAPPGRVGDLLPRWTSTTDLGADSPAFTRED